jgi:hypothetical protein
MSNGLLEARAREENTEKSTADDNAARELACVEDIRDVSDLMDREEFDKLRRVVEVATSRGIRFAAGGGFAFTTYSGKWRDTKDLDLFILPEDQKAMTEVVTEAGFADYYAWKPYDRSWIYRGYNDGRIIDLIWTMPNHRMVVDEQWLRGRKVCLHGMKVRLLPPEELLWSKIYVMQRDRCDWPDLLNVLNGVGPDMDWEHMLARIGDDTRVLGALLNLFAWLCPERAALLPSWLWKRIEMGPPQILGPCSKERAFLLDTRDWFGPAENPEI